MGRVYYNLVILLLCWHRPCGMSRVGHIFKPGLRCACLSALCHDYVSIASVC